MKGDRTGLEEKTKSKVSTLVDEVKQLNLMSQPFIPYFIRSTPEQTIIVRLEKEQKSYEKARLNPGNPHVITAVDAGEVVSVGLGADFHPIVDEW